MSTQYWFRTGVTFRRLHYRRVQDECLAKIDFSARCFPADVLIEAPFKPRVFKAREIVDQRRRRHYL